MTYVPGYDHDVFVSYAHLDDQGESAWVSTLVRHLDTEVRQRLGTKDLRIWIDHELDGNRPLTPEILQAIRRAATIILIVSPSYVASEWCARERNAFLGFARDCVSEGRIFIVRCRDIDPQCLPPEFGDLIGFKFWTQDNDAGGVTRPLGLTDLKEQAYLRASSISPTSWLRSWRKSERPARRAHPHPPLLRRACVPGALDRRYGNARSGARQPSDPGRIAHPPGNLVSRRQRAGVPSSDAGRFAALFGLCPAARQIAGTPREICRRAALSGDPARYRQRSRQADPAMARPRRRSGGDRR